MWSTLRPSYAARYNVTPYNRTESVLFSVRKLPSADEPHLFIQEHGAHKYQDWKGVYSSEYTKDLEVFLTPHPTGVRYCN
jgi:hypothetical protein